jgi:hypothetical protein
MPFVPEQMGCRSRPAVSRRRVVDPTGGSLLTPWYPQSPYQRGWLGRDGRKEAAV